MTLKRADISSSKWKRQKVQRVQKAPQHQPPRAKAVAVVGSASKVRQQHLRLRQLQATKFLRAKLLRSND